MARVAVLQSFIAASVLVVAACARASADASAFTPMHECEVAVLASVAVSRMAPPFVDSLALYLPSLDVLNDAVVFTSGQDNRVVVTDRTFSAGRSFGRRGSGPGDLLAPKAVRATTTGLAVLDGGNTRVSFWSNTGAYLHAVRVGSTAATFAVDEKNRVYTPSNDPEHYVLVSSEDGAAKRIGERPKYPDAVRGPGYWLDMVARAPDGALFVFDNTLRVIVKLSADGSAQESYALPASVFAAISQEVERTDASFSQMGLSGSTAALREFRFTDDGRLFLRTTGDGPFALLLNPTDMSCTALAPPEDSTLRSAVQGAFAMTVADSTLFVASAIGNVLEFRLPGESEFSDRK